MSDQDKVKEVNAELDNPQKTDVTQEPDLPQRKTDSRHYVVVVVVILVGVLFGMGPVLDSIFAPKNALGSLVLATKRYDHLAVRRSNWPLLPRMAAYSASIQRVN